MAAIKDFRRDYYQRLTSFVKFVHRTAGGMKQGEDKFAQSTQGARVLREKKGFIAALEVLRHSKSFFTPSFFPPTC
jgi:hypothetical protein